MAIFNERLTAALELVVSQTVDSTSTGTNANYATTGISHLKFTGAVTVISGFANGVSGKILTVTNGYSASFTLTDQGGGSTAANRIISGNNTNITLQPGQSVMLQYDGDASRWRPISATSVGSNIAGRIDGTTPPAGILGQSVTSTISSLTNAASDRTYLALTSITLTPGTWSISATASIFRNGATLTTNDSYYVVVGTTSASGAGGIIGYDQIPFVGTALISGTYLGSASVVNKCVDISVNTTYYLNVYLAYSAGTPQWLGSMQAIRNG